MTSDERPSLDATDAMVITMVATEAFTSLEIDHLPREMGQGALLLYEAMLSRIKAQLPHTEAMQHVFDGIEQARKTADAVRAKYGLAVQA
jgi:hypothetical protein